MEFFTVLLGGEIAKEVLLILALCDVLEHLKQA